MFISTNLILSSIILANIYIMPGPPVEAFPKGIEGATPKDVMMPVLVTQFADLDESSNLLGNCFSGLVF
jgi:hypothetical protein